tara:strand:+ start:102 stop:278 length:177 start_codon:yes stop_codon:yes gene_type:complete
MQDQVAGEVTAVAMDVGQKANIVKHLVERRIEYLLGSLIAYQIGLLDRLIEYGAGVCV